MKTMYIDVGKDCVEFVHASLSSQKLEQEVQKWPQQD